MRPCLALTSAFLALAFAQGPASAQTPQSLGNWRIPHDRLYSCVQADGSPQVRGGTYKAEFTPEGASYIPFLGSAARENHPLGFRLSSIRSGGAPVAFDAGAQAVQDGDRVRYERGSVAEVYDLGLDSVEQSFVFEALPSAGELVLRLAVESTLEPVAHEGRIAFQSDEGGVRYGAAVAIDAHGARVPAATEIVDGGIEIRVPAEFVAGAAFPLVIDPVITTFTVPSLISDSMNDLAPSVTWDQTYQRYCVVYEEVFSASDHDVVYVFLNTSGVMVGASYVDGTLSAYWASPDVASNDYSNQFYIVAAVGLPSSGARSVHGRTLGSGSTNLGADTDVSQGDAGDKFEPSVGGDPYLNTASYFTVVWTRFNAGDADVHMRQADQNGVLLGTAYTPVADGPSSYDAAPRISKSCQQAGVHHVVWESMHNFGDIDVYGAEVAWSGTINVPATPVAIGAATTTRPACSSIDPSGNWVVVYEYDFVSDHDLSGQLMSNLNVLDTQNLSVLEDAYGSGALYLDQRRPDLDGDGVHFACVYAEQHAAGSADYDVRATTLEVLNGKLYVGESHVALANSTTREDAPRISSQQGAGGTGNVFGAVWWHDTSSQLGNTEGAVYASGDFTKFCTPNSYGVIGCPCGNFLIMPGRGCENSSFTGGASLNGSGSASLAADTVVFTTSGEKSTATSVLMQGPTLNASGVTFGQGVRCVGGSLKRLYAKTASGGSITAPLAGDPSVHARSAALGDPFGPGSTRYYFVYYRDPIVLGGCPGASTFNCTDAVRTIWRP